MAFFLLVSIGGTPIHPAKPNSNVYVYKILSVGKVSLVLALPPSHRTMTICLHVCLCMAGGPTKHKPSSWQISNNSETREASERLFQISASQSAPTFSPYNNPRGMPQLIPLCT